jgi:DNA helicase-2/ATP-dependent DNA helicase PcrA
VGFTRARRRLFTSLAQSRALFGELRFNPPSRFLSEVPQELFGLSPDDFTQSDRPTLARPPSVRRRRVDEGPVIDRTYDQSGDFHQGGDGDVRGMRVHHGQFGPGVVVSVSGRGPTAKLTVRFDHFGVKTVVARFLSPG